MDSVLQDLKYAARVLRRSPGFAAVAALTLALGIGANASIFSLVNGLVLSAPSGVDRPDRLVQIARSYESAPRWDNFSWPALGLIRTEARALSGVAGYTAHSFTVGDGTETEQLLGHFVTGDYFQLLGVTPHLGRLIQPSDDVVRGAHAVTVLSYDLWAGRYAGDPAIVGRTIALGSEPYTVIGVAPSGFAGIENVGTPPALFVPTMQHPGYGTQLFFESWGTSWIEVFGRLADGVGYEEARTSMDLVSTRLRDASPVNRDMQVLLAQGLGLDPEGRAEANQISMILLLIVGLVLLLTCTNVANLLLARASGRRVEVGVRMAIGAGRGRLMRQLVTESVLLAAVATLLAFPLVFVAGDVLPAIFPYSLSVSVAADGRVYAFLIGTGILAGLLFGAAPAWSASRRDVASTLRENAATSGRSSTRMRDGLVIVQLGLSLGLVAGASLLGRSVLNASAAKPGFEPQGLLAAHVDLFSSGRYDEESGQHFFDNLLADAERTPGVTSATLANQMPIAGGHQRATVRPFGREDTSFEAEYLTVGPRYFETMGIPIVRGRAFDPVVDGSERVAIVNEALAAMFWPGEDAVGQEVERGGEAWRVVGVSRDVQMRSLRARANPAVHYPAALTYSPRMLLHVRVEPGSALTPRDVRSLVAGVDPGLPASSVVDLQTAMTASMGETKTIGYLVSAFAVLALVLAFVGLYGLVSFGVSERVREIGIRIALGAEPESLVRLILARGLRIAIMGSVFGIGIAIALGTTLRSLLFGVAHSDLLTLGSATTFLLVAAGVAAWLPARRASRIDAAISLRE